MKIWYLNGTVRIGEEPISPQPPAGWHVSGTHDFNRDGKSDLVVQDDKENVVLWTMDGARRLGEIPIVLGSEPDPEPGHRLLGTVELDHSGNPDLICHGSKGRVTIWNMEWEAQPEVWRRVGEVYLDGEASAETWKVQAAADFDGDRNLDVLVSDPDSSEVHLWRFDGSLAFLDFRPTTPSAPGSSEWKVVAAADFGAGPEGPESPAPVCGVLDVVWQNATSFKTVVWHLNADQQRTGGLFTTPDGPGPGWEVVGPR